MDLPFNLDRALDAARRATLAAGDAAMRWFRRDADATAKADGSIVTRADHDAEAAILDVLRADFPDHDILTEESGAVRASGAATRWIIDPLDGTGRFARGVRRWGPLIALQHEGEIVVGAMGVPAMDEVYVAARGRGCFRNDQRLRVSQVRDLDDAILSLGGVGRMLRDPRYRDAIVELASRASYVWSGGDLTGCALVLGGHADAWIEYDAQVWDVAPFPVLIEEAGGRFTDLAGGQDIERGEAVVSNALLHEQILAALNSAPR